MDAFDRTEGAPLSKLDVLIVEDEALVAMDLEEFLERAGARVIGSVASVREALDLLRIERPDIAVLDVSLKDGMVTPVAAALRSWKIPFVVASAYSEADLAGQDALNDAPKVGKPVSEQAMIAALVSAASR